MSIIGAAALFPRDALTSLFTGSSDAFPDSTVSYSGRHNHRGPATRVDLSDKVKGILARANTDQDVADRLKAFVEAHRIDTTNGSAQDTSSDQGSSTDIDQAFEQLSGGGPAQDDSQPAQDGTPGEFSGFSSLEANLAVQAYRRGHREYITFSESELAATSVAASSNAGAVSATSTGTHTQSVTFAIDLRTGAVSVSQSESTSVSTTVQIQQPNASFSAFA
jgi:hypothetical protein